MSKKVGRNVIFDYGGVFTPWRRFPTFLESLPDSAQHSFNSLVSVAFFTRAAEGRVSRSEFLDAFQSCGISDSDAVWTQLERVNKPDPKMLGLVTELRESLHTLLISDSLPPYSSYIRQHLTPYFDEIFLSDELHARKASGLFERICKIDPDIFRDSVYVDDDPKHVAHLQQLEPTVHGIVYVGIQDLVARLRDVNLLPEAN